MASRHQNLRVARAKFSRMLNAGCVEPQIARLVTDEESVIDGEEHWVVLVVDNGYLAAWIDENGTLRTARRKSSSGAIRLANESWGRDSEPSPSRKTRRDPIPGPYLLRINRDQEDHALDEKHTQIVDIHPRVFLDLTTERGADDFIRTTDGIVDVDFYNSPDIQRKLRVHPHLSIDANTGRVTGHEGRHRAAAVLLAGGPWYRASIRLVPSSRNYKPEQMPQTWYAQFNRNVSFNIPRLLSSGRLRIIDDNVQRQYQKR